MGGGIVLFDTRDWASLRSASEVPGGLYMECSGLLIIWILKHHTIL